MPRFVNTALVVLAILALLPFACIYRARVTQSRLPRIHLVQGMDNQHRLKSQQENPIFADRREARPQVKGTIARGRLVEDDAVVTGVRGDKFLETFPMPVTESVLARGRERFGIYCSPCHGLAGRGDGIVAIRADRLQEGTFIPPTSMQDATVLQRPVGHVFNTITNGIRTMPSYGSQIGVDDRWAIVAYIRALQLSAHAPASVLSAEERSKLGEAAP